MKRVTIKDIAQHLSISVSTVSRALADDQYIRRETREKIFEAARKLNYKPNRMAATLRSGHSNMIGIIAHEMLSPTASMVLAGVQCVMQEKGISVLVACSYNSPEQEARNIHAMETAMVDGIIICPCHGSHNEHLLEELQKHGMPVVFFLHEPERLMASQVVVNSYHKAYFLLDHIVQSGRRKIALVFPGRETGPGREIYRAYRDLTAKFSLPLEDRLIVEAPPTPEGGRQAVETLVREGGDFDAIVASTDLAAIGAMGKLMEEGLRVPDDVAVAAVTGSALSRIVYPKLTVAEPPLSEMGEEAARLLLEKIANPDMPEKKIVVDAAIYLRGSSHPELKDAAEPEGEPDAGAAV